MTSIRPSSKSSFPGVKAYLKSFVLGVENWETEDLPRLQRFSREGSFDFRYSPEFEGQPYNAANAAGDLTGVSNALRWQAIQGALSGEKDWLDSWSRATAYGYWGVRLELFTQHRVYDDDYRNGRRPQYMPLASFHGAVFNAANALNLGWFDQAFELVRRCRATLDIEGFFDGDDVAHRRTDHFVVRLVSDDRGWPERASPRCAFDEPVFEELIARWQQPEASTLVPLLLAVCERHAREAKVDSAKEWHDLPRIDEWYVPFEVLSVLRLRERRGLANPRPEEFDHPLLHTPLGVLPPVMPFYEDDLLQGVMDQVRREWPTV